MLNVAGDEGLAGWSLEQRKDGLAQGPRLGEFGKAPFAVEPVLGQNQNDRFGGRNLPVESFFPVRARRQAGVLVEVQKGLDKAVGMQPGKQSRRLFTVPA